jgi:hypothetical protein
MRLQGRRRGGEGKLEKRTHKYGVGAMGDRLVGGRGEGEGSSY